MAGIQLSGLASGLDWKSLVDQLITAEGAPITKLQTTQTTNTQKSTVLDNLKTALVSLQSSIKALSTESSNPFGDRTAQIAGTSTWTASAAGGTPTGTYQFDVTQLATRSLRNGTIGTGGALSSTSDVSGVTLATAPIATPITAGTFTVNGAQVTIALTDSLKDVFDKISTATGGAVTGSYDPATDKVALQGGTEVVLGAANDTSNFLAAFNLSNNGTSEVLSPKALGTVSLTTAIAHANLRQAISGTDAGGNGTLSVNGVAINYNVNTDSISTVLSRINTSTAGVTASYDKLNDRFVFTNQTTGDLGLGTSDTSGNLLAALGVDSSSALVHGQNAQFSVDGGPTLTSTTNTFDSSVTGITGLTVTATSPTAQAVTINGDSSGLRGKVDAFVKSYNAVQGYIDQQTKTTTGTGGKVATSLLTSDHEVSDIAKSLRSSIFSDVTGTTGTIKRLESLGIDFDGTSTQLVVKDSNKLDAALLNNADDVKNLFNATDGLVSRINTYVSKITGSSGTLATQSASLATQNTSIDQQIATMQRRLDAERARLEAGFIAMEQAQSTINSQLTALNNAFGLSSSSSATSKSSSSAS